MSFPEGIVVAKKTLKMGYDTLKRLCNSNPKEELIPKKPCVNRAILTKIQAKTYSRLS